MVGSSSWWSLSAGRFLAIWSWFGSGPVVTQKKVRPNKRTKYSSRVVRSRLVNLKPRGPNKKKGKKNTPRSQTNHSNVGRKSPNKGITAIDFLLLNGRNDRYQSLHTSHLRYITIYNTPKKKIISFFFFFRVKYIYFNFIM
jgi:hypothetical protein